jgi:Bacterial regulatory proteins, luxR family
MTQRRPPDTDRTQGRRARRVGRTNPETADAFFNSVKTVEANLSRIYRKLAVHSRTELANRVTPTTKPVGPPTEAVWFDRS